jgi:hypothetical protein
MAAAAAVMILGHAQIGQAQFSKATQILLTRGLQLQGLVQPADYFHLDTYSNANYNTINWGYSSAPDQLGPVPGAPWGRWVSDSTQLPPLAGEEPYMSQLVCLSLSDEPYLDSTNDYTDMLNFFNTANANSNLTNTIIFINNWGGEVSDGTLDRFIGEAHPDMITFDQYPWQCVYDTSASNSIGAVIPGPPTGFYGELRRYRVYSMAHNIPYGIYRQTFHAVQDYNSTVFRNPSPSELRLNTFSALGFNAKMLIDFVYNAGATSLFDIETNGYSGDTHTNALYNEMIDVNRRAMNLGKALMRLTPIYEMHNPDDVNPPPGPASTDTGFVDGTTTSIMFLRGRVLSGGVTNATALPGGFAVDPQASTNPNNPNNLIYSWWEANKNDPYLNGWVVTNKAGVKNSGLPGEVILAWFKPQDESFDGASYSNEVYMMVVNGLSDPTGTAANCMQEIKLNFLVGTSISAVVMLDPETGLITTNTMPVIAGSGSSTKRQLVLDLNGGDAALFKFSDGAPFVGQPMAAKLSMAVQSGHPAISIQGPLFSHQRLEWTSSLMTSNWNVVTNLILPTSPYVFVDGSAGAGPRFYRAVATP